ncbi:phosphoenolpyruvate--protein phosphotransferase [Bowdeniella nasicola]|uniref:Phosphoenolpyruvate-protein phosphotransferase n=1 Tax=Bowdeniella nasicola TaxID=208480 RepID=A0A1Q5Q3J9_9ACTO|nr:phosphoenolpyruvate--protein phosphotransferase [Bowdeniella nasicola]OKL54269.1 phosphoenolpyruvate--protein phosphotransferase [Bowdeniella nasicola]
MSDSLTLHGIGVSVGSTYGPAVPVRPAPGVDETEPATTDPAAEGERIHAAISQVSDELLRRAESASGEAKDVLEITAQLATDKGLTQSVDALLARGVVPTRTVHDAIEGYVAKLEILGGYMAQRATDLHDVRDRIIAVLRGLPAPGVPTMTEPGVIVAHDLAPAETAVLKRELVRGIVISGGGPTSHTAIIASGMGIPAVVQTRGADDIVAGELVALDGGTGEVIVRPDADVQAEFTARQERRLAAVAAYSGLGVTSDGHAVALLANVGTADEAARAAADDVEGVGLFRTEFMFLDRQDPPSREEQAKTYTEVLEAFGERRVVIRTLDAGADKPLAFADLGAEENPALGRRGLRLSQAREELLDTQLDALADAYHATKADMRIMAPMVATLDEATWFAGKLRERGLPSAGIMIETPASAIRAEHLLADLDFASIGTNDLTQYTMAADRMQGELGSLLSAWQPAVIAMMKAACDGAKSADASIGVCGEAAGDPLLALVLVGLGVSSLSMAPSRVPEVRAALATHSLADCQAMADAALAAPSLKEARDAVAELASS